MTQSNMKEKQNTTKENCQYCHLHIEFLPDVDRKIFDWHLSGHREVKTQSNHITETGWFERFDEEFKYSFNVGVVPDDMTKNKIKSFISQVEQRAERRVVEEIEKWAKENKRIYGYTAYLWLMDARKEFKLEDFDGTFEKQAIVGYNTALNDLLTKLTNKR